MLGLDHCHPTNHWKKREKNKREAEAVNCLVIREHCTSIPLNHKADKSGKKKVNMRAAIA
jgi:hypothetical protein